MLTHWPPRFQFFIPARRPRCSPESEPGSAYGLNLACGLWSELQGTGVDVLAVCPGMTDTKPVQDRELDKDLPFYGPLTGPEPVALQSLRALGRRPIVVPTLGDRLSAALLAKLMPRGWTLSIVKRSIERLRG